MFKDENVGATETIAKEIATNFTAPTVFCQALIPFFLNTNKPYSIIFISSGLGFVPAPFAPVYCATKAAIHSLAIAIRTQLFGTNIHITEVFPQYVATGLDSKHRDKIVELAGGPGKGPQPMALHTFIEQAMIKLDAVEDGKPLKEIAVGVFPEQVLTAWRAAMSPWIDRFGRER